MRILLINAEQDERLFATFKHEHILYDQQPESDTLDISENIYDVIVYNATKLDEKTVDAVRSLRESGARHGRSHDRAGAYPYSECGCGQCTHASVPER